MCILEQSRAESHRCRRQESTDPAGVSPNWARRARRRRSRRSRASGAIRSGHHSFPETGSTSTDSTPGNAESTSIIWERISNRYRHIGSVNKSRTRTLPSSCSTSCTHLDDIEACAVEDAAGVVDRAQGLKDLLLSRHHASASTGPAARTVAHGSGEALAFRCRDHSPPPPRTWPPRG
jgi:hypothetical protein